MHTQLGGRNARGRGGGMTDISLGRHQTWWVKKPIISRPGVARPEGERLVFVWAPLYVGGGGSCIPEACM